MLPTFPIQPTLTSLEIQQAVNGFQIAQSYFSNILEAQTAIFSLLVGAIVALYFFFNWKISKDQIKREANVYFVELKAQLTNDFNEKMSNLEQTFSAERKAQDIEIGTLTGQNHRTLGQFWESEKNYAVAFLWWFRGAHQFTQINSQRRARICLSGARRCIEQVESTLELDTDDIGEYQKLLSEIPESYKIEKESLDTAVKTLLSKKP